MWFWLKNAGVMVALSLVGFLFVPRKLLLWSLPLWGLFLAGNLFIFQPWDWDNTKLFTYWWLITAGFAALVIGRLFAPRPSMSRSVQIARQAAALLLFLLAMASGALDVFRLTQHEQLRLRMVSADGLELAGWARENTPLEAVFLTADNHDNPIAMLSGRAIVLGYGGWLWSWGIDASERLRAGRSHLWGRGGGGAAPGESGRLLRPGWTHGAPALSSPERDLLRGALPRGSPARGRQGLRGEPVRSPDGRPGGAGDHRGPERGSCRGW